MNEYKVRAKKQLGQHFLKSEKAIFDVVNCLQPHPSKEEQTTPSFASQNPPLLSEGEFPKIVIEIGPGMGVLTKALLEKGFTVYAVEIDKESIKYLQENFTKHIKEKQLIIIEKDFLELDIDELILEHEPHPSPLLRKGEGIKQQDLSLSYYLVGNIPYYITGLIFRKSFAMNNRPKKIVYLVQKEVAERVVARDKKESILSMSIKFFGNPKIISIVRAGSFNPPPKVDSAILEITPYQVYSEKIPSLSKEGGKTFFKSFLGGLNKEQLPPLTPPNLGGEYEKLFFTLIKTAFKHKRKTALSNLKKYLFSEKTTPSFASQPHPSPLLKKGEGTTPSDNLWKKIQENTIKNIGEKERAEDIPLSTWLNILN